MPRSKPPSPSRPASPHPPPRRLQMADLARLAGVSASTVSRALNHSPLINPATTKRIEELARSLNYSINTAARHLRSGSNRTIAVVVPYEAATRQHVSEPFFLSMLGSLADALTDSGYDMLLSRIDAERLDDAFRLYDSGRAAGIILIGQWRHHDQLNALALRRTPLVVWGARMPEQLYCTVGSDNRQGGRMATEHLLAGGCRRIAFFGDTGLPEVAQRHAGYLAAHKRHGLMARDELRVSASFLATGAEQAVQSLTDSGQRFDAVFACSDLLAMTTISALDRRGLKVPNDIAVVGYDDIEMAAHFNPPLTTVRQSIQNGGQALVTSLLAIFEGHPARPVLLPAELVVRASSVRGNPRRRKRQG